MMQAHARRAKSEHGVSAGGQGLGESALKGSGEEGAWVRVPAVGQLSPSPTHLLYNRVRCRQQKSKL